MEFRLLGWVGLEDGGREIDTGHSRQRCVLAALLIDAREPVMTAELVSRVWGGDPPDSALNVLYGYVTRLRKVLAPSGVRLLRRGGGYLIDVDPALVDALRFKRLQATDPAAALEAWRGKPLPGIESEWADQVRADLSALHLSAQVRLAEEETARGRHTAAVDRLNGVLAEHPLEERVVAVLMTALFRAGNTPQALDCYLTFRRRLSDELGIEPGPRLRLLHQRILEGDSDLDRQEAAPVPAGLPYDVPGFVGRATELAAMNRVLGSRTPLVISAIEGMAGVGKSALAVRWAHRVRERFPDGSLYADLGGHAPTGPADPARVLGDFLAALGTAPARVPGGLEARSALFRALLDQRRILVILDNARSEQQVRPLLPTADGCATVITSRVPLHGLVVRERAQRIVIGTLTPAEAESLLRTFVPYGDAASLRELARLCAHLPVALCVAGEKAARGDRPLPELVAELRTASNRLDLLEVAGDPLSSVRAVFSWSYRTLPEPVASMFRRLGAHPGPDIEPGAAAVLTGCSTGEAAELLGALAEARLIEPYRPGRWRMHDLLRAYSVECGGEQDQAVARLLDHYLDRLSSAIGLALPGEVVIRPDAEPFPDQAQAQAWMEAERSNLVAAADMALTRSPALGRDLGRMLVRHLDMAGQQEEARRLYRSAADAARVAGDLMGEASALTALSVALIRNGELDEAHDGLRRAVELWETLDDPRSQGSALGNIALVQVHRGQYAAALTDLERAAALFERSGHLSGQANVLNHIGEIHWRTGAYRLAVPLHERAMEITAEIGDRAGVAVSRGDIGNALFRLGEYSEALEHLEASRELARSISYVYAELTSMVNIGRVHAATGNLQAAYDLYQEVLTALREAEDRDMEAETFDCLGEIHLAWGEHERALDHHRRALELFRASGSHTFEASALNGLGEVQRALGHPKEAAARHQEALELTQAMGDRFQQARALAGLARLRADQGLPAKEWGEALRLMDDMELPEAAQLREELKMREGQQPM
ncbi:tetratricopeptide repeat protein [Sphaerisporangium sp. NPDC005288]|uniref:AfsR/SARP family transcriptional regulator n=1 Tax=Sphaerisporangium sp. NPDC005288 TaxID=3155114 RepID=UPI0033B11099